MGSRSGVHPFHALERHDPRDERTAKEHDGDENWV
jgi:hypothetical protein